eukprot:5910655-Pyramimonas_sp.AAC.1
MVETQWPTPPCGVIREPHLQIRPTPRAELMKTCNRGAIHQDAVCSVQLQRPMQSARRAESIGAGSRSPVEHRVGVTGIAERMPYARCAETSTDLRLELPLAREAL